MAHRQRSRKIVGPRPIPAPEVTPPPLEEEPMHRYVHTIPTSLPQYHPVGTTATNDSYIEEALARQNQLLIDILSAINGLTAATLRGRTTNQE